MPLNPRPQHTVAKVHFILVPAPEETQAALSSIPTAESSKRRQFSVNCKFVIRAQRGTSCLNKTGKNKGSSSVFFPIVFMAKDLDIRLWFHEIYGTSISLHRNESMLLIK